METCMRVVKMGSVAQMGQPVDAPIAARSNTWRWTSTGSSVKRGRCVGGAMVVCVRDFGFRGEDGFPEHFDKGKAAF
jgi:hypothetical protein